MKTFWRPPIWLPPQTPGLDPPLTVNTRCWIFVFISVQFFSLRTQNVVGRDYYLIWFQQIIFVDTTWWYSFRVWTLTDKIPWKSWWKLRAALSVLLSRYLHFVMSYSALSHILDPVDFFHFFHLVSHWTWTGSLHLSAKTTLRLKIIDILYMGLLWDRSVTNTCICWRYSQETETTFDHNLWGATQTKQKWIRMPLQKEEKHWPWLSKCWKTIGLLRYIAVIFFCTLGRPPKLLSASESFIFLTFDNSCNNSHNFKYSTSAWSVAVGNLAHLGCMHPKRLLKIPKLSGGIHLVRNNLFLEFI